MSERFFSSEPITSERVTLDGGEAHHLLHVMRARVGELVTVFDDSGFEFAGEVEKLGRCEVALRIIERRRVDRELPFPLIIGIALPKGDRQKWLVEKLTELGVTTLVPLATERGVAQPVAGALDRLRRAGIEAAKQCGRNRLMRIAAPQAWSDWLSGSPPAEEWLGAAGDRMETHRLVAHAGGKQLSQLETIASQPTQVAIGPEGGFTERDIGQAMGAGWQLVDLGPRILRVETAAVAIAAAITLR
jgi:16S rRNA (uracil1498-N3)-methyltransferase